MNYEPAGICGWIFKKEVTIIKTRCVTLEFGKIGEKTGIYFQKVGGWWEGGGQVGGAGSIQKVTCYLQPGHVCTVKGVNCSQCLMDEYEPKMQLYFVQPAWMEMTEITGSGHLRAGVRGAHLNDQGRQRGKAAFNRQVDANEEQSETLLQVIAAKVGYKLLNCGTY